jgi:F-type H+-transporting ATPase subunit a
LIPGHHLRHLQNHHAPQSIADFSYINYDSLFWSVTLGLLAVFAVVATAGGALAYGALVEE